MSSAIVTSEPCRTPPLASVLERLKLSFLLSTGDALVFEDWRRDGGRLGQDGRVPDVADGGWRVAEAEVGPAEEVDVELHPGSTFKSKFASFSPP